jgi:hypothetical protein
MSSTRTSRRIGPVLAIVAALAMLATLMPSNGGRASDHLDAPGLTSPGGDAQADLNDLYAFPGAEAGTSVFATTVVPAAPADATFGSDIFYEVKVDTDGDAVEDQTYEFTFSDPREDGSQFVVAQHATDEAASNGTADGALVGFGQVGKEVELNNGARLYTGLRSDPFFFDLEGFLGTVEGADNDRELNDGDEEDFFAGLDTLAIVIEIPDTELGLSDGSFGEGLLPDGTVGVWATTSDAEGNQIDRLGRPAINTVVNSSGPIVNAPSENKDVYNQAEPRDDVANFTGAAVSALQAYSSLDTEGAYSDCQAEALASVLLPDILPYTKTDTVFPSPLVGRALDDDVIDTALGLVTGGDPLTLFGPDGSFCTGEPLRDAEGAINTDGVDPHEDYLDEFPYLGEAHADVTVPQLEGNDFAAALSGDNEVPPVETEATGVSALTVEGEAVDHLTLAYGLESAVAAHIHLGDPDENGPVVAFLYGPTEGEDVNGMLSEGSVASDDLIAGSLSDLVDVMNGGFAYVNAHTTENPAGEIRGQIQALDLVEDRFQDDDGNVHEENIDIIAAAGITLGCNPPDNTEYCPERNITRGEMAAFMSRGLNLEEGPDAFTDDSDSIFEGDIDAIAAVGISRGCNPPDNTEYCPERDITRGEMAAFVVRAWDLPATDTDHFEDDAASVFEDDINALAEAGVTRGCNPPENDEFCPTRNMSRSEMASFLARAFGWGS